MERINHVLCAIDLGPASDHALREADRIARRAGASLTVLHVVPDGFPGVSMLPGGTEEALLKQQELIREVGGYVGEKVMSVIGRTGGEVSIEVESGVPHEVIVERAQELGGALVVVASSSHAAGHSGMLGSVAAHVARHSPAAVLVSRPRHIGGHVVAATDFSAPSELAVEVAYEEACDRMAPLVVMHSLEVALAQVAVGEPGMAPTVSLPDEFYEAAVPAARARLEDVLRRVPGPGEALVVEEPPSLGIPHAAARLGADLVVVGASHRTAFGRLVSGSVADAVVRDAPCSVLVARPHLARSGAAPQV